MGDPRKPQWKSASFTLLWLALFVILQSVGCATPYQPATGLSFRGGYIDHQLTQDTVFVGFYGNGYTKAQAAGYYLLYRCAEVADQEGAEYFITIGGDPSGKDFLYVEFAYAAGLPIPFNVTLQIKLVNLPSR